MNVDWLNRKSETKVNPIFTITRETQLFRNFHIQFGFIVFHIFKQ